MRLHNDINACSANYHFQAGIPESTTTRELSFEFFREKSPARYRVESYRAGNFFRFHTLSAFMRGIFYSQIDPFFHLTGERIDLINSSHDMNNGYDNVYFSVIF